MTKGLRSLTLLLLAGTLALPGCGYTTSALLPKKLDTIYVENFKNELVPTREISNRRSSYIYLPGIENEITRSVIDAFIFDRHLDIDTAKNSALVLKGSLVDIRQYPLSYDKDQNVVEYRIELLVNIELYNNLTEKVMWAEDSFMGQSSYDITGPNRKTLSEAQKEAVKDLAKRIVERTVENW